MAKHTLSAQKAALQVAIRGVPDIAKGQRISPSAADLLKAQLMAVFDTLLWIEDNERDIREAVLAKRRVA